MTDADDVKQHAAPRPYFFLVPVCLAIIMILAFGLRAYHLREQSIWYDEYISIAHLDMPSLTAYLRALRPANWNMVPLYFTLEYAYANLAGPSVFGLRLLSVLFGILAIPVIYALGRELYGRGAGLVAALGLALSAVHVFQAQEIRYYALTSLFALCSAYTLLHALRSGGARWWMLHFTANILLMWTFLFAAFLIVAEACFVVLSRLRRPRALALWFGGACVSMIPSALWIAGIRSTVAPMGPIPKWVVMNSFIADFRYGFMYHVPPGTAWQFIPGRATRFLEDTHAWTDNALLALVCLCAAALGFSALRALFRKGSADANAPAGERPVWESFAFLACWVLVPGLTLLILAKLWRPDVFATRYTAYSSFGAYLIIGGAVQRLRTPFGRAAILTALAVLMGHHLAAFYTHPQRTDWRSATDFIKAHRADTDVYLAYPWVQGLVFDYSMRPIESPVPRLHAVEEVCEQTEAHLADGKTVWAVFAAFYHGGGMDAPNLFERYVHHRNIGFSKKAFWSGMQCLFLYRISGNAGFLPLDAESRRSAFDAVAQGYRQAPEYVSKGGLLQAKGDLEGAATAYREALALDPLCVQAYEALGTLLVNEQRDYEAAITLYREALEVRPDDAALHAQLAIALDQHGDSKAAFAAVSRAIQLEPYGRPWIRTCFNYLQAKHAP